MSVLGLICKEKFLVTSVEDQNAGGFISEVRRSNIFNEPLYVYIMESGFRVKSTKETKQNDTKTVNTNKSGKSLHDRKMVIIRKK